RTGGLERLDNIQTFERLHREWLDEMVADLLVVIWTRLALHERDLQALARVESGSGAASDAGADDDHVKRGLTGHVGRLCSKCCRRFLKRGIHSSLMNPWPVGPNNPGSISSRSVYNVESPRRSYRCVCSQNLNGVFVIESTNL